MGDMNPSAPAADADFDLGPFYQVFFEEAAENLERMEQMLLQLDVAAAGDDELNAIFRCAHSIKGGAATFGFADVTDLTHQMESLLDRLRRRELLPTATMVDVLLTASDALKAQLTHHQGHAAEAPDTTTLLQRLGDLARGTDEDVATAATPGHDTPVTPPSPAAPAPTGTDTAIRDLLIVVGPLDRPGQADGIAELFRDIDGLGDIEPQPEQRPDLRRFRVRTRSSDEELLDLFSFHVRKDQVHVEAWAAAGPSAKGEGIAFGFFEGAPGAPANTTPATDATPAPAAPVLPPKPTMPAPRTAASAPPSIESGTLRVPVGKIDQLINLVGELVITQAMLAQKSRSLDGGANQALLADLAALDRHTRDLQEAVMSIRMIPMAVVFNRFPRLVRDLATKMGKKVELLTHGEATELDKGLIEKITDPLTHLIRNSCDHGIEPPEERRARGKPEHGTIALSAAHQGGSILIEVRDDGRGLSRHKLLAKARDRGLDAPDTLTDAEVWNLIFAPGFSTAEQVTDVSGRGVGMDVVKKNIDALGGTVEIDSVEGQGMGVRVRLPLTLAIMDAMSVRVGHEVYILPLSAVVESFQVGPGTISTIGQGARLVKVRDEYVPVIDLERVFQVPRDGTVAGRPIMVVVEAEGARAALQVDELLGQQQVVIKNLETNYRKVPNVSGATILGDGRVALILDTSGLVRRARHG
jgi:two-component system chemotaxis sensor kinase CheA